MTYNSTLLSFCSTHYSSLIVPSKFIKFISFDNHLKCDSNENDFQYAHYQESHFIFV